LVITSASPSPASQPRTQSRTTSRQAVRRRRMSTSRSVRRTFRTLTIVAAGSITEVICATVVLKCRVALTASRVKWTVSLHTTVSSIFTGCTVFHICHISRGSARCLNVLRVVVALVATSVSVIVSASRCLGGFVAFLRRRRRYPLRTTGCTRIWRRRRRRTSEDLTTT